MRKNIMEKILFYFSFLIVLVSTCFQREYEYGIVCVCNKTDCDVIKPLSNLKSDEYQMYTSSMDGARFEKIIGSFSKNNKDSKTNVTLLINRNRWYQKIYGFGGAFTDSTGINLLTLSTETREQIMRSYFTKDGVEYSMGRVPIGGTDFSLRPYTLDDVVDDFDLNNFSLQEEDNLYKIPFIQQAKHLTENDLKLFASAWTAPAWMKTNNKLSGIGFLNESMYNIWAEYYVRFFDEYHKAGINFWGVTTGNEPANGYTNFININDMGWVPSLQAQWIRENLGPKLKTNDVCTDIKIMIIDDQRVYFPWIPRTILEDPVTRSYVDGLAVHYYDDSFISAEALTVSHYDFPDKFILATEGCEGSLTKEPVMLGSWERAENYLNSIFDDLNNWVTGWMDWNMALDLEGGPTYVKNYVDSPIIVNKTADEFYKQPMYYALGHFSKFLRPDSVRLHSTTVPDSLIKQVVFKRPDGKTVVQLFNPNNNEISISIHDNRPKEHGKIYTTLQKRSINTIIF